MATPPDRAESVVSAPDEAGSLEEHFGEAALVTGSDAAPTAVAAESRGPAAPTFALRATEKEDGETETCAICFEPITAVCGAVELPCHCTISYCPSCWDRHLAQSMATLGEPRCPSCRSVMRVDFEADTGRLVFSEQEASPDDEKVDLYNPNNETRKRLCDQARPRQIDLLKQYGSMAGEVSVEALPRCVCSGKLERLGLRDRVSKLVNKSGYFVYDGRRFTVDDLIHMGAVTCDLCNSKVRDGEELWTCENGVQTILHSHSYDICAVCVQTHAFGGSSPPMSRVGPAPRTAELDDMGSPQEELR